MFMDLSAFLVYGLTEVVLCLYQCRMWVLKWLVEVKYVNLQSFCLLLN